jgi:hypothetical protein
VDNDQAKRILSTYRPGVDDAEPDVAEALAHARRAPDLQRWLESETKIDATLRGKLRDVTVPVGLKTRILANASTETSPVAWWRRRPVWLAAAVAILIVEFVLYWPHLRPENAFTAYRAGMVQYVAAGYKMDLRADSFEALRQQFVKSGWPSDYTVPPALTQLTVEGGCQSQWRGRKVSLLCLEAKGHDVWLLVIDREGVWHAPPDHPVFAYEGNVATASWTAGHLTYVLATQGDDAELKGYF